MTMSSPQIPKDLLAPINPKQWEKLPTSTQMILAMAVFVIAVAAALSLVLWVLRIH